MPLTKKGRKIMRSTKNQYGAEKGERVFFASRNKGVISGVESRGKRPHNREVIYDDDLKRGYQKRRLPYHYDPDAALRLA